VIKNEKSISIGRHGFNSTACPSVSSGRTFHRACSVHQRLGPGQVRTWEAKRGVEDASYLHETTIRSCGVQ
jgi:hypothetical protein